jgi:chromosome segregation ATPase
MESPYTNFYIKCIIINSDEAIFTIEAINLDPNQHWSLKATNLKKIATLMGEYVSNVLDISNTLNNINASDIVQKNDQNSLLLLCEYLPLIAVKCDKKETYIQNMLSLNESMQNGLMNIVASHIKQEDASPIYQSNFHMASLEEEINRLEELHDMDESKIKVLETNFETKINELDSLNTKYNEVCKELQETQLAADSKKVAMDSVNDLTKAVATHESTIESLQSQIHTMDIEHEKVVSKLSEKISIQEEQIASLTVDSELLMALKSKLSCFDDIKQQYEEMKNIIEEDNTKISLLESKLKEAQNRNACYAQTFSADSPEIKQTIELELQLKEKSLSLNSVHTALVEGQRKTQFLEEKLKQQSEELNSLKLKVPINGKLSIEDEQKIIELQSKVSSLSKENELLKRQTTSEELLNKFMEDEVKLKSYAIENKKLTSSCNSYVEQIASLNKKVEELSNRLQQNTTSDMMLNCAQIELNTLKAERDVFYKKQEENDRMLQELADAKGVLNKMTEQSEGMQNELKQIYKEKSIIEAKYAAAQDDKIEQYKELQDKMVACQNLKQEMDHLSFLLEECKESEQALQSRNAAIEVENTELKKGNKIESSNTDNKETIDKLNSKIQSLQVHAIRWHPLQRRQWQKTRRPWWQRPTS